MSKRPDDGRKALNAIESDLWASDPEFYRQFEQAWFSHAGRDVVAAVPRRAVALWLVPLALIVIGVLLCMVVIQSRP